jgi:acetyltransferase
MLERAWAELVADRSARAPGGRRGFIVRKQLEFALSREVRIAVRTDPLFGPVIGYGATSMQARELALMLPPLNRRLAVDLIAGAQLAGASPDVQPLVAMLLELSALLCALPWVVEMELDPWSSARSPRSSRVLASTSPLRAFDWRTATATWRFTRIRWNSRRACICVPEKC